MKKDQRYIHLKKGNIEMIIDRVGAQVVSYKVNGVETIFQGALEPENSQWKASAKNLFPNPGPVGTKNEKYGELETEIYNVNGKEEQHVVYIHNGGKYHMGQHGFAQSKIFDVRGVNDDSCVLAISANSHQTYTEYPYDYTYYISLGLNEDGFEYSSCAQNNDTKPMLAGMGWHPAFKLHDDPSRYTIVFKNVEKPVDGSDIEENIEYSIDGLVEESKSQIFTGIYSADVVLLYTDDKGNKIPYLSMHIEDPILVLWSRKRENDNQENFICIEPWNTLPKQMSRLTTQDKTEKLGKGANIIAPGERSTLTSSVSVNPEYIKKINHTNKR